MSNSFAQVNQIEGSILFPRQNSGLHMNTFQAPQFKTQDKINQYNKQSKKQFTLNNQNIKHLSGNNAYMLNRMTVPTSMKGVSQRKENLSGVEGYDAQGNVVGKSGQVGCRGMGIKNFQPHDSGYNSQFSDNYVVFDNKNQEISVNKMYDGVQNGTISGQLSPQSYESPYLAGAQDSLSWQMGQYQNPHNSQQQQQNAMYPLQQQQQQQQQQNTMYSLQQQQHEDFTSDMRQAHQPRPPTRPYQTRLETNRKNDPQENGFARQFENQSTYNNQEYQPNYMEYTPRNPQMQQQIHQQHQKNTNKSRALLEKQQAQERQLTQRSNGRQEELNTKHKPAQHISVQPEMLHQRRQSQQSQQQQSQQQQSQQQQSQQQQQQQLQQQSQQQLQQQSQQQFQQQFQQQPLVVLQKQQDNFLEPPPQEGIYDNTKDNYNNSYDPQNSQQRHDFRNPYMVHGNNQLEQMRRFKNGALNPSEQHFGESRQPILNPNFHGQSNSVPESNQVSSGGYNLNEAFMTPSTEASFMEQFTQVSR